MKLQGARVSINNYRNRWTQMISITKPLFYARVLPFQIFNDLPDRIPLYGKRFLPVGKIAQQGWNPNDWQKIILFADSVLQRSAPDSWAVYSCVRQWRDKWHSPARQAAGQSAPPPRRARMNRQIRRAHV